MIADLTKHATEEYSKILTRYPMMDRSDDAKKRLAALHQPIPRPTKGAVAQNKAEIASRGQRNIMQMAMDLIKKGPDVSRAPQVGEPTLLDPTPLGAQDVIRNEALPAMGGGDKEVGVTVIKPDQPEASAPPAEEPKPGASPFGAPAAGATPPPATSDANELKPNAPADPNELKPTDDATPPPPTQVNEIQQSSSSKDTAKADDSTPASDEDLSSSKKKHKKGLKKVVPF